jgi:REP element-mobilizing transposase RayT
MLIHMSRPLRVEFDNAAYHVTSRGNEGREIFNDDADRRRFVETLGDCCERFGLVVHAYCLMPNHYHLLVQTPRANLSRAIGWLQTTYCIRFNRRHGRSGHLVQGRFKAHLIQQDAYARQVVRYVHLNPVRPRDRRQPVPADRKEFFESYLWSSHRAYAGTARTGETPPWLCTEWLSYWGQRRAPAMKSYRADVNSCFGHPIQSPLKDLRGGLVLGDEALWKKVRKLLSGRARKQELRWSARQNTQELTRRVARLIENEQDWRVKLWARVLLAGEPLTALAREWGYSDPSGVHQVVRRLAAKAESDRELDRKLEVLKQAAARGAGV